MTVLSSSELEKLSLVITDIYAIREAEEFFGKTVVILKGLLCSDTASYNESDKHGHFKGIVTASPDHERLFKKYESPFREYLPTHPGFRISSVNRCTILSDLIRPSVFERTELYNEYYRHLGIQSQLFTELPAPAGARYYFMLSRTGQDFAERDRFMLGLLKPHVIQAYRNVMELHRYREKVALFEKDEDFPELRVYGLTRREAVILNWAAKGKTNADIAMILDISKRTVEKHFERIYEKLGVETKMAAVSVIVNTPLPIPLPQGARDKNLLPSLDGWD